MRDITPEKARAMRDAATPEPWEAFETEFSGESRVVPTSGGLLVAECRVRNPLDAEQMANARLIAVAPTLATLYADTADKLAEVEKERDEAHSVLLAELMKSQNRLDRAEKAEAENKRLREELLNYARWMMACPAVSKELRAALEDTK